MKNSLPLWIGLALLWPAALSQAEQRLIFQDGQWVKVAIPAVGTPEGEIALMQEEIKASKWAQAVKLGTDFAKRYPGDEHNEQAMFLTGEAEMGRGRYWQAFQIYEKQLGQYATGPFFEQALMKEMAIADAFLAGKRRPLWGIFMISAVDDGLEILDKIAERFPNSSLAEQAMMKVADYHFAHKQWGEAADAYQRYIDMYGKRFRGEYAEFRAAQATLNSYKGPQFDDTPLLEAQPRFEAYAAHYPVQARENQIPGILNDIENEKARKDFETAQFYTRVCRPGPAAFYHRQVIQLYPGTVYAERSRKALGLPPLGVERPATEAAQIPLAPASVPIEQGQSQ